MVNALIDAGDFATAETACAAAMARCRDVGDLQNLPKVLASRVDLDLRTGRLDEAAAHLREHIQIVMGVGLWFELPFILDCCGHLCSATGHHAEAITAWAAMTALLDYEGMLELPAEASRREEASSKSRQALGAARASTAQERGAAMSMATAAEYALMLTAPEPRPVIASELGRLSARERSSSPWWPGAAPTRRSPPSCTSASGLSGRTWTGSGTRPAAAVAPT
jgi:hypothetical protein